jgi:hypothetical protein
MLGYPILLYGKTTIHECLRGLNMSKKILMVKEEPYDMEIKMDASLHNPFRRFEEQP